ncbi:unnamed protein product [Vicia faba]|uniref:Uncharacterized protein n=1 Tax=Vicia faba TaxID=3906 RepID=A0AAV0Z921_VICFA|nr:unnamed protein product [Vicia faba]
MDTVPDQATSICPHCDRAIPAANIDLHSVHCLRNLEKCKVCGDMVPKQHAEDHYLNTHAPVACSLCSETMGRDILDIHKGEKFPQRIVTCEFCRSGGLSVCLAHSDGQLVGGSIAGPIKPRAPQVSPIYNLL